MADNFQYDVFLSYSVKDTDVVRDLARRLRGDGLRVWFDEREIHPGDSIPAKIEAGLENSRVLVLCMSAHAFGSDWAQLESGTFRFRDPLNQQRRFIPLRLDDAPIKGALAQFPSINWLTQDREREYAKLLDACRPRVQSQEVAGQVSREAHLDGPIQRLCHELRVPAVAFRAALQMVRRECDIKGYHFEHDYLSDLEMYSELLARLLKEADILRFGPKNLPLNPRPVLFVRDVLAPAIRFAEPFFRERRLSNRQVRWSGFENVPRLHVDPSALTQVAFNLIDNAIKYYDGVPSSFVLEVTAHRENMYYEIRFTDFGMGVLDLEPERVFEKGFRSPRAATVDSTGNGIGLWISRELMLRHGGDLRLRHHGKPTVFTMLLPVKLAHQTPRFLG